MNSEFIGKSYTYRQQYVDYKRKRMEEEKVPDGQLSLFK